MGNITRNFANLITADGTSGIPDGTVTNADLAGSISTDKLAGNINFKNIIINGDMSIAQRSTSVASITTTGYYTVDRWNLSLSSLGTWTMSQDTDVPTGQGFAKSLKLDCTTADAAPAASDYAFLLYSIEGQNLQYLKKGTANAESLTLSFWVKSNKIGTYIIEVDDNDNQRNINKSYTINSANTWEKKTITFAGDTTGAFDNDNGNSLRMYWWLGVGTNWSSGTLATSWENTVNANRAVGQVNLADSTANEFYLTGVQLEAGTTASDFEFLPVDVNKTRCKRYFQKTKVASIIGGWVGIHWSGTAHIGQFPIETELRTSATVAYASTFAVLGGGGVSSGYTVSGGTQTSYGTVTVNLIGTQRASSETLTFYSDDSNTFISFDAEL